MSTKVANLRSETLAEGIRRSLETLIVSGELQPGCRLDEIELAGRFNASRTPVREALSALAAGGLVEMRSRQGAVVTTISISTLLEMFQVMAELEGLCARFAARRATSAEKQELQNIHEHLSAVFQENDLARFYEVNREFHEALYNASHAEFISEQTRSLRNRVSPYRRYVTGQPGRMAATLDEHDRVLRAIMAADADEAQQAMRHHVTLLGDNLTDFIASLPSKVLKVD